LPALCGLGLLLGLAERVPGLSAAGAALLLGAYPMLLACITRDRGEARAPRAPGEPWRWLALASGLAAGFLLGGVLMLGTIAVRSPVAAAGLFGVAACAALVLYLRRSPAAFWRLPVLAVGMVLGFGMNLAEPPQDAPAFLPGLVDAGVAMVTTLVPGIGLERAAVVTGAHDCALMLLEAGADWRILLFALVAVSAFVVFGQGLLRTWARFPAATETILLGALLGGMARLWPWQLVSAYTLSASGEQLAIGARAVRPATWAAHTGADPAVFGVAAAMALAAVLTAVVLRVRRPRRNAAAVAPA
jgi:uncharacterized membrane protein